MGTTGRGRTAKVRGGIFGFGRPVGSTIESNQGAA
ncbi:MAG: hypothetical protein QOG43_234 [Actinomycetota bacterium]|jgi:hypothetical protein|nr:hypothetical protein [Actinomycetota bacterium]